MSKLPISDEVHQALRIRAAETGESMEAIAERALRKELGLITDRATERLARELFAAYRRNLAVALECSEDELLAVTENLADEDFETRTAIQNAAEEAAWAEARRNPEWPRPWSDDEDIV